MKRSKVESYRQHVFGKAVSGYLWCLHCERAYPDGAFREVTDARGETQQMCPYDGCDGDAVIDAWDWAVIRIANPDYPKVPGLGVVYPRTLERRRGPRDRRKRNRRSSDR